jgi:hypothetical protein
MENQNYDAYVHLLNKLNMNHEEFLEFGLAQVIPIEIEAKRRQWLELKNSILTRNNEKLIIRNYGRDGKSNILFMELYEELFNKQVKFDSTNNSYPQGVISKNTFFRKKPLKKNKYVLIQNYQIAHLHGKTKNPFFFTALWNISLIPRYLDPFTGHEKSGLLANAVSDSFKKKIVNENIEFLNDYKQLFEMYITEERVIEALNKIQIKEREKPFTEKILKDFEKEALFNLLPIF